MAKQVVDCRPSKGFSAGQSNEELRVRDERSKEFFSKNGNYDLSREHLNFEVVNGEIRPVDKSRSIPLRIQENLASRGIKDPNEGLEEPKFRTVENMIFGGSRERMHELAFGGYGIVNLDKGADNSKVKRTSEIEAWAKDIYRFVADRYGEENIAAFIVHLDELNPHIHCSVLPVAMVKGKMQISYKKVFAGKDRFEFEEKTQNLHNDLAKVNEKWGLERGDSIAYTGAKHRSTEEYKRDLSRENTRLEKEISVKSETARNLDQQIKMAETRVKGLSSMIANLENRKAGIENELEELALKSSIGAMKKEAVEKRTQELTAALADIEEKLADKREKLATAEEQLDGLNKNISVVERRTEELKEEAKPYAQTVQQQIRTLVEDAQRLHLLDDFKSQIGAMDEDTLESLDGSVVMQVAERGETITRVAMLLFVGAMGEAMACAQSSGGGGGNPGSGWGKKDDEDDKAWARRCVEAATRMTRPLKKIRKNR